VLYKVAELFRNSLPQLAKSGLIPKGYPDRKNKAKARKADNEVSLVIRELVHSQCQEGWPYFAQLAIIDVCTMDARRPFIAVILCDALTNEN